MSKSRAAERWALGLATWAIPEEILAGADSSPWIFPAAAFVAPSTPSETPSRSRAREGLDVGGEVLDVGCGGGAAGLALVPPAIRVTGVDSSAELLGLLVATANDRGVTVTGVEGRWPDCAGAVPMADVVVCHHVVYNAPDIVPFVRELDAHARRRVVVELTARHPLSGLNDAWSHFWGVERPSAPTAEDFVEALGDVGLAVRVERWSRPPRDSPLEERAAHARVRLCLPASREAEVLEYLRSHPLGPTEVVTVWWDATGPMM